MPKEKKMLASKDVLKYVAEMLPGHVKAFERIEDPGIRFIGLKGVVKHKHDSKLNQPFEVYPFISFGLMVDVEEIDAKKATQDFMDTLSEQEKELSKMPSMKVNQKENAS